MNILCPPKEKQMQFDVSFCTFICEELQFQYQYQSYLGWWPTSKIKINKCVRVSSCRIEIEYLFLFSYSPILFFLLCIWYIIPLNSTPLHIPTVRRCRSFSRSSFTRRIAKNLFFIFNVVLFNYSDRSHSFSLIVVFVKIFFGKNSDRNSN